MVKNPLPLLAKPAGTQISYTYTIKKTSIPGNIELAYIDEGLHDKPVLLFIHGVAAGLPVWNKNIEVLKHQYRCIALDLPGHGFSSKADFPYTIKFYTEVVTAFIRELGLSSVTLVGLSMGAQIAVKCALLEPEIIQKLILVGPSGIEPYMPWEKYSLINSMLAVVTGGNTFSHSRLNYITGFYYDLQPAYELMSQMAFFENEYTEFNRMMFRSIEGIVMEPIYNDLKKISKEYLVIVAEQDIVSPYNIMRLERFIDLADRLTKEIPNAHFQRVKKGGHFLPYQEPETVNDAIVNFTTELSLSQKQSSLVH